MRVREAVLHIADDAEAASDAALAVLLKDKAGAVDALVAALAQPMPKKRFLKSVRLVAAFHGAAALPVLLTALERGTLDSDERSAVAIALGELVDGSVVGNARVTTHALRLSREPLPAVRQAAVVLLSAVGGTEARARLQAMATDADPSVAARAADAIAIVDSGNTVMVGGDVGVPIDFEALISGASAPSASAFLASSSLSSSPSASLPAGAVAIDLAALVSASSSSPSAPAAPLDPREQLMARLRDPRWTERQRAVEDVVAAGKDMVPLLIERLGPDVQARMGICLALSRIQAPEAASSLLMLATSEAKTSDDRDLQAVALKALANSLSGTEEGVASALLPLLKSPDPFVRSGAVICLGRLADRIGARAAALMLAKDPHSEVRKAAAIAISESVREDHTDLVLPLLATLTSLPSPPAEGKEAILIALSRIDLEGPAVVSRVRHRVRRLVFGLTAAQRRLAIAVLDRCYDDDDPPPPWVVEDVLTRLADADADVRLMAASFVARFLPAGLTEAVRRLEDALEKGEPGVSMLVCDALKRHDTPLAKKALEATASGDENDDVRAHASALLEGFEPQSSEWTPSSTSAASSSSSSSPASSAQPPSPMSQTASTARRVRSVRDGSDDDDVVIAKDGAADDDGASAKGDADGAPTSS
jgi:HEAT repeat protein